MKDPQDEKEEVWKFRAYTMVVRHVRPPAIKQEYCCLEFLNLTQVCMYI